MEKLCKELDDAKATIEKLVEENRVKTELSERLRKTCNEQVVKMKEAKLVIEKQEEELNAKAEEMSATKQMYEDVKIKLHEKESALKHLSMANDKLRADSSEKVKKLGEESRELVFALDEANTRTRDQETKIDALKEEIERLKGLLAVSKKKCFEAEQKAKADKELRHRDELTMKVEEENTKIKDMLKWKKEQFKHLEEALEKLQDQFRASKKEWENERCKLFDEICSLQTSLDSQTRITENLQRQLQMCNQALAHEESRRKLLEVEVSESKMCYENVYAEYQESKTKIERLTCRRDEEIAELRNLLGQKESLLKEAEFRKEQLEHENQDMLKSLKELQEAQIQEAGTASTLSKLRNKLRGLEQVHKECSAILKTREAEWSFQMDSMIREFNAYRSESDRKDEQIGKLQLELEGCHSSIMQLKIENFEVAVMLEVFRSGVSDAQSKLSNSLIETQLCKKEKDDISLLMEQLEQKDSALVRAHDLIGQERETVASLRMKIESLIPVEQKYPLMQKELQRCKELLEESNMQQLHLKEEALQTESALKEDLSNVSDDLNKISSELSEKTNEVSEIEFELDRWKCAAENLKSCLDENQEFRREMEASILAQVETEQNLKQKIVLLEQELSSIETEVAAREFEALICLQIETDRTMEQEKERHLKVIQEKDQIIIDLQSQTEKKHIEINTTYEAFQKIVTLVVLDELEIQEKNLMAAALEEEMTSLQEKLKSEEKSFSHLKQQEELLQAQLEVKQLEMDRLESRLSSSEGLVKKLEFQKEVLLQDVTNMSSERGNLLYIIEGYYEQITELSKKDVELTGRMRNLVQSFESNCEDQGMKECYSANRENISSPLSSTGKKVEAHRDGRSPLKECNN